MRLVKLRSVIEFAAVTSQDTLGENIWTTKQRTVSRAIVDITVQEKKKRHGHRVRRASQEFL